MTVCVIGAGLFGATIARKLAADGHDVTVVDDLRPNSGSAPSGCLMKPSWFKSLRPGVEKRALETLDTTYGVRSSRFVVWPTKLSAEVLWVPRKQILDRSDLPLLVDRVHELRGTELRLRDAGWRAFSKVIVAAGYWSRLLVPLTIQGKWGCSFEWQGSLLSESSIRPWAPYKQVVTHCDAGNVWSGDGSALLSWSADAQSKSVLRVESATGLTCAKATVAVGVRPYCGEKPCILLEHSPGVWVATGGAKTGLLAAGWAASRLSEALA